jgi:Immunity protein 21
MNTTWIYSAGGPLICAAYPVGLMWSGTHPNSTGEGPSDYDRACGVMDYVGIVPCASSQVLVLGDEPLQSAFVREPAGLAIVRWVACASASAAELALAAIPAALPQIEEPKSIIIEADRLVLFDSACSLADVPQLLEAQVTPGLYEVSTQRYSSPGVFEFLIHRLAGAGVKS